MNGRATKEELANNRPDINFMLKYLIFKLEKTSQISAKKSKDASSIEQVSQQLTVHF